VRDKRSLLEAGALEFFTFGSFFLSPDSPGLSAAFVASVATGVCFPPFFGCAATGATSAHTNIVANNPR
jgi:hypothetical protein